MAKEIDQSLLGKALEAALDIDRDAQKAYVAKLRADHPGDSDQVLAERVISRARWFSAGVGVATGLPSNPWVAAPAAVADVAATLRAEVVLAARVALLYEPGFLDDGEPPYELLVPIFGGRLAGELLREAAIRGGMGVTRAAIRKYLSKETLKQFKRLALKYFGLKVTQRGVITKTLPVVGGLIGGTWNFVEVAAVGRRVVDWFEGRCVAPTTSVAADAS